ncbi:HU family DNA-binding protein [Candidatus Cytomitobacter primus]|nr:HU family DNA-binding protein [Candidatus Cytomitobacter primus]
MNYSDLQKKIAANLQINIAQAKQFLEAFKDVITETMLKDEMISWTGFLKFDVKTRAAGKKTNPKTKETIFVPEKEVPKVTFPDSYKKHFNDAKETNKTK